jgi:hypothetical protein
MTVDTTKPTAPAAEVAKPAPTSIQIAGKKIKNAWIAGLVSASFSLVFVLMSLTGANFAGINAWGFIDIGVILGLSYGVFRKSRTCAVLLFCIYLLSKLIMWSEAGKLNAMGMALVFLWFFGQGIVGTFQYHKLIKNHGDAV